MNIRDNVSFLSNDKGALVHRDVQGGLIRGGIAPRFEGM